MRLAFITGRLEPGRDGVGDYVRTLARECARLGHAVALVSLAESHPVPESANEEFPTLRLEAGEARGDDGRRARAWLERFAPDWTSLHFVVYSFHPRGLFQGSITMLARVAGAAPHRQIFFHELWIGAAVGAPWRERLTGWAQRRAIGELLRRMQPRRVNTSIGYYRRGLATLAQPAEVLPMFGSVPLAADPKPEDWPGLPANALVCGMFGALHPNWIAEPFLADFAALGARLGRPAVLASAGALRAGEAMFDQLTGTRGDSLRGVRLGEKSTAELARIFARFDFAVTSAPWNMIGKASSVAALREHGVPVVVTNPGTPPRFGLTAAESEPADAGLLPYFRARALLQQIPARTATRAGATEAARQFLADLGRTGAGEQRG